MSDLLNILEQAWENAERGVIKRGDLFIEKFDPGYSIHLAAQDFVGEYTYRRIVERAKPAWADAEYVLARDPDVESGEPRLVYQREKDGRFRWLEGGIHFPAYELRDVSILVEQEVAA